MRRTGCMLKRIESLHGVKWWRRLDIWMRFDSIVGWQQPRIHRFDTGSCTSHQTDTGESDLWEYWQMAREPVNKTVHGTSRIPEAWSVLVTCEI